MKISNHDILKKFKQSQHLWVVRAGEKGSADDYFIKMNIIVLKKQGFEDLSQIEPTRQSFYQVYRSKNLDASRTAIAGIGGKFFRFIHEMKTGEFVLYPSLKNRMVYCGEIMGEYKYDRRHKEFPHQREIRWIASVPKKNLSKKAQHELGAARTLYKYKNNIKEIIENIINT
jgi:restriction system protein